MRRCRAFILSFMVTAFACGCAYPASAGGANVKVIVIAGVWDNWSYSSGGSALWFYGGDASGTSMTGSPYMLWFSTNSASVFAEIGTADINESWAKYVRIKCSVKCSSVNAPFDIVFYDGTNWNATSAKNVSAVNTWQDVEWSLPSGTFNWKTVKKVIFRANTGAVPAGTFYADSIKLLR
jgi:hypothetical protein